MSDPLIPPKPLLLTEQECLALWDRTAGREVYLPSGIGVAERRKAICETVQSAAALGARKALEMVRDYHRKGGEVHETWLHKRIREVGGDD